MTRNYYRKKHIIAYQKVLKKPRGCDRDRETERETDGQRQKHTHTHTQATRIVFTGTDCTKHVCKQISYLPDEVK